MKNSYLVLWGYLLTVTALVTALLGCGGDVHKTATHQTDVKIDLFGDDLVLGRGLPSSISMRLGLWRPNFKVTNFSASGLTLGAAMNNGQLKFENIRRGGDVVVIALGLNDALVLRSTQEFERDLRSAIAIVRAENRIPVLTGLIRLPEDGSFSAEQLQARNELNMVTLAVAKELSVIHARWDEKRPKDQAILFLRAQYVSDHLAQSLINVIPQVAQ